ncbi:6-phosphogluconolactonase [Arthrobacter sp. UYCu511]|uniref:lactonase family protein n=1 Tax=Arthrobacter sp. UYCu511 TaxID=3156337 RepID=UPI0033915E1E
MAAVPSLLVSGYTEAGSGTGPGIARYELLADGVVGERQAEAVAVTNPSFMARSVMTHSVVDQSVVDQSVVDHGKGMVISVEELPHGNVVALDMQTLEVLGRASSGGADSCHVAIVDDAAWVANYSSGTAAVVPLAGLLDGTAAKVPELLSHPGSGPVSGRQGESHAHQVTATAWGTVLVSDLGADRVDEYSASSRVRIVSAELPPGTGPRHVALRGDYLLVAGELDGHLHVLQRALLARSGDAPGPTAGDAPGPTAEQGEDGHSWRWLFRVPLAESAAEIAASAEFFPSHIELSADGKLLYAAVRGPNTIVVLDVTGLPANPDIRSIARPPEFLRQVSSGGRWPRHFAVVRAGQGNHKLYVANQHSDQLAVFVLDERGLPEASPVQMVNFASPACVVPVMPIL